ncbi:MAG: ABC transporter substrate-binding protein [Verrucomicrobiae bacterium]|nr:ABC transporter substrate-binding protein [Verrucomicrobiae bacterium]
MMKITLGHSPDPDDAFMFYALATNKLNTGGLEFEHILQDIQTLNERATRGELHVTAISIHAYCYVLDKYALLPSGCSMGDKYGPMIVAKTALTKEQLAKSLIAIPGTMTTAFLALKLYLPEFRHVVVPFDQIFKAVKEGKADAGLIIHEGQLTYQKEGLKLHVDLGKWWFETTGLPLPLGGNVVRKDLGKPLMKQISDLVKQSIRYGLDHRPNAIAYALNFARDMDTPLADRFVGMYVNDWTLDYGDRGREAIRLLLRRGHEAGVVPNPVELEFV